MKITDIELFKVPPRWVFLKITTEDGIVGWGEPVVEGKADTVVACVEEFKEHLIGQDADQIEKIWQRMYRCNFYRGGAVLMSAMSGIDQALWDIKGKRLGVPVYELLGGAVRDKLKVYSWIAGEDPKHENGQSFTHEEVLSSMNEQVRRRMEQGYTTVKTCITNELGWVDSFKKLEAAADKIGALRQEFGYDVDIAVDFHGRVHMPMARMLIHELEQYKLLYIEEPLLPEHMEGFMEIRRHCNVPIATGERIYGRWGFKDVMKSGAVDIIQPDLSHAGGIWECRKIAAMAEAYDMSVAPHCPLGPIAFASCVQLDFCTPNAFIQEQSIEIHENGLGNPQYLVQGGGFEYQEGFVLKPNRPGLGITVDEEKVREAAKIGHCWHNVVWSLEDGTPIEW